jgi:hypothetical protein
MDRSHHPPHPGRATLAVAAVIVVLAAGGYVAVMSGWQSYDDEGYVLMSLRQFAHGADLYDQTYTQYGPLFYELFGLPFRTLGHDAARLLTLVFWLAASAFAGLLAWRLAGRAVSWGVVGLVLAFTALLEITAEPLHPGGFLTVVMGALATTLVFAREPRRYVIAGALVATLGLTKINLGGLAAFAIAFSLAIDFVPRTAPQRIGRAAVIAACAALPILLMASSLGVPEWRWLAVSLSATLLALAAVARPQGRDPLRAVVGLVLGAGSLTALVVAIILAAGTSLSGLVNGVLVEPLGLSDAFNVPPRFDFASLAVAVGVLALVVIRRRQGEEAVPPVLDVAVGVVAAFALVTDSALPLDSPFLAPMLAPVLLVAGEEAVDGLLAVSCLVLFAALQAYPVAGSQVSFGTFLAVVPTVLILRRGLSALVGRLGRAAPALAPISALGLAFALFAQQVGPELSSYRTDVPMNRPGAKLMRVEGADRDDFMGLLRDMRGCRTLVTYPGVLSLNLWSKLPPPSPTYAGDWMFLLNSQQQSRIVRRVKDARAVCIVEAPDVRQFWSQGRRVPRGPLVRWIEQVHGPATHHGRYTLTHVT